MVESAHFQPTGTRRIAKALGMSTESSYRFERGVDPEGVLAALDRAAQLMVELGDGELAAGSIDVYPVPIGQESIQLHVLKPIASKASRSRMLRPSKIQAGFSLSRS